MPIAANVADLFHKNTSETQEKMYIMIKCYQNTNIIYILKKMLNKHYLLYLRWQHQDHCCQPSGAIGVQLISPVTCPGDIILTLFCLSPQTRDLQNWIPKYLQSWLLDSYSHPNTHAILATSVGESIKNLEHFVPNEFISAQTFKTSNTNG